MTIAPWFLPALLTLVLWGVVVFLPKLAVRTLAPLSLAIYSNITFFLGVVVIMALQGFHLEFEPMGVFLAISIGLFGGAGQLCYIYSIRQGAMTNGMIVSALYPIVAMTLAFFILGEKLTTQQIVGVILGLLSLVLMVIPYGRSAVKK